MENQLDGRSKTIQQEEVRFKSDGTVDLRSVAVKNGTVRVCEDGTVDMRSSAVRKGELNIKPTEDPSNSERRTFTQQEKDSAWGKADTVPGMDSDKYRQDKVGNIIYYDNYGKNTPMGWDVDHSKPLKEGGTYHPNNLQVMQAAQNRWDKSDTYPYNYSNNPVGVTREELITTPIDKRSSAVVNNEVLIKVDGTIDCRSAAVKQGNVLVTKDGQVDKRSAYYKSGQIALKPSVLPNQSPSVTAATEKLNTLSLSSTNSSSIRKPSASSSSTCTPTPTSYNSGTYYSSSSSSYSYSTASYSSSGRAPSGGTIINGTFYKGGQFLPKGK